MIFIPCQVFGMTSEEYDLLFDDEDPENEYVDSEDEFEDPEEDYSNVIIHFDLFSLDDLIKK